MIEFLFELVVGGLFELFAEIAASIYNRRNGLTTEPEAAPATDAKPWAPLLKQNRSVTTVKLLLGATAGAAWGYYVGSTSDVGWPLTFWSFAAIGAITFALRLAGFSNERRTSTIKNRFLRSMVTFTPTRFSNLALLSLVCALAVAAGFLIA